MRTLLTRLFWMTAAFAAGWSFGAASMIGYAAWKFRAVGFD